MHSGCTLVCCPACGYQTVNPRRSKIIRLVNFLFTAKNSSNYPSAKKVEDSLADVPAGRKAKVIGFSADFPPDRRTYLQAYGLVPNYWVQVLGHSPVTIVRLDNIELALENELVGEGGNDIPLAIHIMAQGATAPEPDPDKEYWDNFFCKECGAHPCGCDENE